MTVVAHPDCEATTPALLTRLRTAVRAARLPAASLLASGTRIGIGVGTSRVCAVGVRGDGRPLWAMEAELEDGEQLADALTELLSGAPIARGWRRPTVIAAVGPGAAQVKRLAGLPAADDTTLAAIVAQGAGRFFLKNGIPLVTTGVRRAESGDVWAGAIEAPVADAIETACRAARLTLGGVAPTVVALGRALEGERHLWVDGELCAEVITARGEVTAVRRVRSELGADRQTCQPLALLAALGVGAERFADAYGAASLPAGEPLLHRASRLRAAEASVPGWRLALAVGALTLASLSALVARGVRSELAARDAAARLAAIAPARSTAVNAERELARLTAAMGEAAAFDAGRRSMTLLLRDLTAGLPDRTALVTLRVDSAGGTLVALGPRAAAVIPALERVPSIASPEIVGPVTREVVATVPGGAPTGAPREVERVTVRFRLATAAAPSPHRAGATP